MKYRDKDFDPSQRYLLMATVGGDSNEGDNSDFGGDAEAGAQSDAQGHESGGLGGLSGFGGEDMSEASRARMEAINKQMKRDLAWSRAKRTQQALALFGMNNTPIGLGITGLAALSAYADGSNPNDPGNAAGDVNGGIFGPAPVAAPQQVDPSSTGLVTATPGANYSGGFLDNPYAGTTVPAGSGVPQGLADQITGASGVPGYAPNARANYFSVMQPRQRQQAQSTGGLV